MEERAAPAGPRSLNDVWRGAHPGLPHVLLVVDQFPKSLGGGERTVLRLAELLPAYGFRASVLTFAIDPESSVLRTPWPFPLYLLPLEKTYDLRALRGASALRRFLREQKVRLVQTFFESSDLWAGLITRLFSSAKLVWSRRDMGILRSTKHRLAYRVLARMPDRVFAVSESVRRQCIEQDSVNSSRVCTLYNGVDLTAFVPSLSPAKTEFTVVCIGNIRRVKGHDVLVRAAALTLQSFPGAQFLLVGDVLDRRYFMELQEVTRELGIEDNFHFIGAVPHPHVYLEKADAFVLPSRSEGFSNAILEAMNYSLPVIATAVGGNAEAVVEGVSGLIVAVEDVAALAQAIKRLAADRVEARRMGAAGRLLAEERFSTGAMMRQFCSAYRELLGWPDEM